ncbi:MAG: ric [Moraxellaceae bacterium]|jgi:regulator of cell morphogenesis and NO signaling|nr:ric [Moraxellaceae bacterium]
MDISQRSLGDLARDIPGATRVFHAHRLDFCCGGRHSLQEAALKRGLDPGAIASELAGLQAAPGAERDWRGAGNAALVEHLLARYHEVHRQQLPELIRLARRVEQVHGAKPDCPNGLADHLAAMQQELESHMQKEEQVLFPLLTQGRRQLQAPIAVLRFEHEQHGEALARLEQLAHDFVPPAGACNTWQALYRGLAQFREDLMQHIHLENNLLFEGLAEAGGAGSAAAPYQPEGKAQVAVAVTGEGAAVGRPATGCGCGGSGNGRGGCS